MAVSADGIMYSDMYINGYERGETLTRKTVTTEAIKNAGSYKFLIGDTNGASATTRGTDSRLTARSLNNTQVSITLNNWYDLQTATDFNIFTNQAAPSVVGKMTMDSYTVLNRKVDDQIITALGTATDQLNTSATASNDALGLLMDGLRNLGENDVPTDDGNVYAMVTHAFIRSLQKTAEFSNMDYVPMHTYVDGVGSLKRMYMWNGINIFTQNGITGAGGTTETCLLYHKTAIGHVIDKEEFNVEVDYNKEHKYSFVSAATFCGAGLLQDAGVMKMYFTR